MNQTRSSDPRGARRLALALAATALAGGLAVSLLSHNKDTGVASEGRIAQTQTQASVLTVPRPLPDIELVDQTGEPFALSQLAGHWSLLFFGFTHCPDVCPTTLSDMRRLRKQVEELPDELQPNIVFVSVDPERDTPDAMAAYLAFFDAEATGLTGTIANIEALTRQLGVAVMRVPGNTTGAYTVDHTAALFAVNPNAELAAIFVPPHSVASMASDWRSIVGGFSG